MQDLYSELMCKNIYKYQCLNTGLCRCPDNYWYLNSPTKKECVVNIDTLFLYMFCFVKSSLSVCDISEEIE